MELREVACSILYTNVCQSWNLNSGLSDAKAYTIPTILDHLDIILKEFDFYSARNVDSKILKRLS